MPLFDFKCTECSAQVEKFMRIADRRDNLTCDYCGGKLKRVIVLGHGGFQRVNPLWLDSHVRGCLQDDEDIAAGITKPIEDRHDYNRHLMENNIVPLG